jgi:hypothetical protein
MAMAETTHSVRLEDEVTEQISQAVQCELDMILTGLELDMMLMGLELDRLLAGLAQVLLG